eukprot:scaffold8448_cov239-Pinguiococcus_pyrenoidosus.AAC.4
MERFSRPFRSCVPCARMLAGVAKQSPTENAFFALLKPSLTPRLLFSAVRQRQLLLLSSARLRPTQVL